MENFDISMDLVASGPQMIALAIAYVGGLITAFTPCVYPLIPITIGVMGARQATSLLRSFFLSLTFVAGLSLVYSVLGFTAASTGQILGAITQKPVVIWSISTLFLAMGLSLLGLFEFRLPSGVNQWLSKRGGSGFGGSLALGAVSGLLAAPCSGPVLVGILAYVAHQSNPLFGFLLLFVFAVGLGTPFVFLGTFSQQISNLPKTGVWTEWAKHLAGLGLIATFYFYIHPIVSPLVFRVLLAFGLLLIAVLVKRIFPGLSPAIQWTHQILRYTVVFGVGLLFAQSFIQSPSDSSSQVTSAKSSEIHWIQSESHGLQVAQSQQKPTVIDFWAEWCVACKELDARTYSDKRVQSAMEKDFVPIKIDSTEITSENRSLYEKYRVMALPTILFTDSKGKVIRDLTVTGFVEADEFLVHLKKAKDQLNENGVCMSC